MQYPLEDQDLIRGEIRWELQSRDVCLEKKEGLEMRGVKVGAVEFDGNMVVDTTGRDMFASDGWGLTRTRWRSQPRGDP